VCIVSDGGDRGAGGQTRKAAIKNGVKTVTISGGVSCNQALRESMGRMAEEEGLALHVATPVLSTDNAAMIGAAGLLRLEAGEKSSSALDVDPNLKLCQ